MTLKGSEQIDVDRVAQLADRLAQQLDAAEEAIDEAHIFRAGSSAIQHIVSKILCDDLGFREEVIITPQDGLVSRARPDFVFQLGPGRGVIAEVERGGAVTNNHDLKDMWKAHVAPDVQHLILIVPFTNWNANGLPRERPFVRVTHRMQAFFGSPRREIDVLSCHIFGYGRDSLARGARKVP